MLKAGFISDCRTATPKLRVPVNYMKLMDTDIIAH